MSATVSPAEPTSTRQPNGRFAKNNPGGPGNPFARQVAALRSALLARVSAEDIQAVAEQLLRQAREGNVAAARLLLSYAVGKPAPAVDPDTLDQQEWEQYRRLPDPTPEMAAAPQRLGLPVALTYMRAALPKIAEAQGDMMLQGIRAQEFEEQREAAAREERRARRAVKKAAQAAAPSANGSAAAAAPRLPDRPCQAVPPPSPNGGAAGL